MDIADLINPDSWVQRIGLLVEKNDEGNYVANVRHVRYHSLDGFACGYSGSGPADLALSVLHALIPPLSEEDELGQQDLPRDEYESAIVDPSRWSQRIGPEGVRVNNMALILHTQFKEEFIAAMPEGGGHIPIGVILSWIQRQKHYYDAFGFSST